MVFKDEKLKEWMSERAGCRQDVLRMEEVFAKVEGVLQK